MQKLEQTIEEIKKEKTIMQAEYKKLKEHHEQLLEENSIMKSLNSKNKI